MCGINGIVRLDADAAGVERGELLRTRDAMARRGPDAAGEWLSADGTVGLGHRRLAVIDLSPDGNQPMSWDSGRYWIVFNGEIYNYRDLRTDLEQAGVRFHSHSDTEVILALYAREGVAMLTRLRGMFAIAIWDGREQRLLLARDPYGIKPLYYAATGRYLRFASQVKALEASGAIDGAPDPAGVVGFLLWGTVPEPFTIRRAIRALPAGHHVTVERGHVGEPHAYHHFGAAQVSEPMTLAEASSDSVRAHLVSDVPVAIFMSAGLDSTSLAALACRHLSEPPLTFTLRFQQFAGTPYDEAPIAAKVAEKLGTRHLEKTFTPRDVPDLWERVTTAMDQPSIDGFNTYLVCRLAHEAGLKVVLSGLGGDELFGGYASFRDVPTWARWARRAALVPGLAAVWPHVAQKLRPRQPKLRGLLRYGRTVPGAYYLWRGLFLPEELSQIVDGDLVRAGLAAYNPVEDAADRIDRATEDDDPWQAVHILESTQYMRNQLLRDSDWASMAHSLELRVPWVDLWLREQVARLNFEPGRSAGKAAAVRQVAPELPPVLWTRPKSGFFVPVMDLLREPATAETRGGGRESRRLALRVLREFVDLPPSPAGTGSGPEHRLSWRGTGA